ncbi:maleylpyruvate isomerase family mycothiol-dependent enzyme [Mycobacterium sp. 48b]|uniref:maleylpyruvate isomerase family mycothiol-dependent enzyme n=1 Tax=Mycobacterium sp. 48b TaxID=3400426 RepID=UPI003AAD886F
MLDTSYRNARLRVAAVAAGLDETQLLTPVPATPGWTVHDLLAHLVGGAADGASGRLDGAGGARWTARHVAERQQDSVESLLAEWERVAPVVEVNLAGQQFTGPNLAADLICHEADLSEALGLPPVDRAHWHQPFLTVMMRLLVHRLKPLTSALLRDEQGNEWHCGSEQPALTLDADGYELFRAMFSRRSRRQIAAWNWMPAPGQQVVESFGFFGPRDDDQPLPRTRGNAP